MLFLVDRYSLSITQIYRNMVAIKTQQKNLTPADEGAIVCSICDRNDKVITDTESGEVICGNCSVVMSYKVEDTSHLERHIYLVEDK